MRLGLLHETCVQPAPKSRLAVTELPVFEDQDQRQMQMQMQMQMQSESFPAKAGPTVGANLTECTRCF
jgi:hypothetical protein